MGDSPRQPGTPGSGTVVERKRASVGEDPTVEQGGSLLGRTIADGKYEIVRLLGEGGMGAVYQARQIAMDRMVALKLIRPEVVTSRSAVARFKKEMLVTAKVEHPNTIRVYDFGETEGQLYLTMEYLAGASLRQVIDGAGRLDLKRIVRIAKQVANALGAVHERGLVHRDLKPENVMLIESYGETDFVKVLDFGIAKSLDDDVNLTGTGRPIGTPAYMSPEQAMGAAIDARTDLYALGVMLYRMASGRMPFNAPTAASMLLAHATEEPMPVLSLAPDTSPVLATLIMQLLDKDPAQRPANAGEVVARLEDCLQASAWQSWQAAGWQAPFSGAGPAMGPHAAGSQLMGSQDADARSPGGQHPGAQPPAQSQGANVVGWQSHGSQPPDVYAAGSQSPESLAAMQGQPPPGSQSPAPQPPEWQGGGSQAGGSTPQDWQDGASGGSTPRNWQGSGSQAGGSTPPEWQGGSHAGGSTPPEWRGHGSQAGGLHVGGSHAGGSQAGGSHAAGWPPAAMQAGWHGPGAYARAAGGAVASGSIDVHGGRQESTTRRTSDPTRGRIGLIVAGLAVIGVGTGVVYSVVASGPQAKVLDAAPVVEAAPRKELDELLAKSEPLAPESCRAKEGPTVTLLLDAARALADNQREKALQMLGEHPASSEAWALRARAQLATDAEKAQLSASEALRLCPGYAVAYNLSGNALQKLGNLKPAENAYVLALTAEPVYDAPRFNLGLLQLRQNDPTAVETFTELLRRRPDHPNAYLARAQAYAMKGDNDAALADLDEAVRRQPTSAEAWASLGELRERAHKGDANAAYCRAKELGHAKAAERCKASR
ncbi:MAG TPA: protein kinase [Kofleriaceae bacterium]|nr:protein kinase [Kofleriaceae bacterium]